MLKNKLAIIIPAYNEASVIDSTLVGIRSIKSQFKLPFDLIVVDDGSHDKTGEVARVSADVVLTHIRNCGLGASLATGIEYAKREGYDYAITYDADGQHTPEDILRVLSELQHGKDVVIGSRFIGSHERMPPLRRYILMVSNLITYLFFGVWTTDSQSGFRGLGNKAITTLSLKSNRMEVSSEFFGEIKRLNLSYGEVPIHVKYTDYSLQKGQSHMASFNVLLKLLYLLGR